jgi:hypothetical protein
MAARHRPSGVVCPREGLDVVVAAPVRPAVGVVTLGRGGVAVPAPGEAGA